MVVYFPGRRDLLDMERYRSVSLCEFKSLIT